MKRLTKSMLLLAAMTSLPAPVMAGGGGLLQTLPKDGTWTRYFYEMKAEGPAKKEVAGTITLKSVGATTENGKTCRWIELEIEASENGKPQHTVLKFLVSEKSFKPGSKETLEIIRGWSQQRKNGDVNEFKDAEKNPNGPLSVFFGGDRKSIQKLKEVKTIDYQKGKLKVGNGTSGKLDLDSGPKAPKIDVTQSFWPSDKIPFGIAVMELRLIYKLNGKIGPPELNMTFRVEDYGTGAKSALPDKN